MFPVCGVVEGFLGARASRPHNDWHGLGHLLHLDRPAAAPRLAFGLAVAVTADVVAACKAARKLSDHHKNGMRAGRPRSQGQSLRTGGGVAERVLGTLLNYWNNFGSERELGTSLRSVAFIPLRLEC